jgi:hypothetical protein
LFYWECTFIKIITQTIYTRNVSITCDYNENSSFKSYVHCTWNWNCDQNFDPMFFWVCWDKIFTQLKYLSIEAYLYDMNFNTNVMTRGVSLKTNEKCHDTLCITLYMIIVEWDKCWPYNIVWINLRVKTIE